MSESSSFGLETDDASMCFRRPVLSLTLSVQVRIYRFEHFQAFLFVGIRVCSCGTVQRKLRPRLALIIGDPITKTDIPVPKSAAVNRSQHCILLKNHCWINDC